LDISQSQVRGSPLVTYSRSIAHHLLPIYKCAHRSLRPFLPSLLPHSTTTGLFQSSQHSLPRYPCVRICCHATRLATCFPHVLALQGVPSTHFYMKRTHRLTAIYGQRSSLPASNAIGQLLATLRSAGVLPSFVRPVSSLRQIPFFSSDCKLTPVSLTGHLKTFNVTFIDKRQA